MQGYVAVTDSPPCDFVEELMELYPEAKVIVTTRDPDDWWRSMEPLVWNIRMAFLGFAFSWLPTLRWFATYMKAAKDGMYEELHFRDGMAVMETYEYHMEYLSRVVQRRSWCCMM